MTLIGDTMELKKMRVRVPTKLNIRTEPSLQGRVIGLLDNKTIVEVGEKIDTADGVWYRLEAFYYPKSESCFPLTWNKQITGDERRVAVRNRRYICGSYLRRVWFTRKFKLYG